MSELFLSREIAAPVGAWLGTYLVHSTVLFLAALLLTRLSKSPAIREPLWRAAMFGPLVTASLQIGAGLAPVSGMWSLPEEVASEAAAALGEPSPTISLDAAMIQALLAERHASPAEEATALAAPLEKPGKGSRQAWALVASALLAVGIAGLTVRAAIEAIRAHRLGGRQRLRGGPIVETVERMRRAASITRRVRIETTPYGASPYATGVLFPRIVLPEHAFDELDEASQRAMLAHELGHIARMDPFWTAAARSVTALFFFQPLNFLTAERLDETAEFACDEFAVGATGDEIALARCLATVAEWIVGPSHTGQPVPACPMAHAKSKLGERVERILATEGETQRAPFGSGAIGTVAIIATAMAVPGVAIAAGQGSAVSTAIFEQPAGTLAGLAEAENVSREPMRRSSKTSLAGTFADLSLLAELMQAELERVEVLSQDRVLSSATRERLRGARAKVESLRAKTLYLQSKVAGR